MSLEERTTSSTGGQKGIKLERFDLIPVGPLTELALHFGRGASKYDAHQWRAGYEWSKSYSAIQRHLTAFWAGYDYDICENDPDGCSLYLPDGSPATLGTIEGIGSTCYNHTGSHHMVAVAWHSFVLLEFKDTHPDHDDRYKVGETSEKVEDAPDELPEDFVMNGSQWVHFCPESGSREPLEFIITPYGRCGNCGTHAPKIEIGG